MHTPPEVLAQWNAWCIKASEATGNTQTTFATNYDEIEFRRIPVGASEESVISAIGQPMFVVTKETDSGDPLYVWNYSFDGPRDTHYFVRRVYIGVDQKVIRTEASFYWD